jgi:hypothetical protein
MILQAQAILRKGEAPLHSTNFVVPFQTFAEKEDPAAQLLNIHRRPLDDDALSSGNLRQIKGWLKECDERHERCISGLAVPTRLVFIKDHDIRLLTTLEMWMSANISRSATAPAVPLKTTADTLEQRLKGIPFEIMPLTFQDALTVAKSLDISYIWIDSLCIIQDDEQD